MYLNDMIMKKLLLIALTFVPLLSMAQDDIYFTPKKKTAKTTTSQSATVTTAQDATVTPVTPVVYNNSNRSEDDYNRRYNYNKTYNGSVAEDADWQSGGGKDSLAATVDSVKSGYSRDMSDAEDDYYYSRRLLRFHSPRFIGYRSPYYWDLVYGCGCYDFYDYWYDDPFYWDWGWGCGWAWGPWSCWYGPMWGYVHPFGYDYWGWGGYWGPGFVGPGFGPVGPGRMVSDQIGGRRFRNNSFNDRAGGSIRTNNRSSRSSFGSGNIASSYRGSTDTANRGSHFPTSTSRATSQCVTGNNRSYGDARTSYTARTAARNSNNARSNSYNSRTNANTTSRSYDSSRSNSYSNSNSTRSSSNSTRSSSFSSGGGSFGGGSFGGGSHTGGGGFGGGHSGGGRR